MSCGHTCDSCKELLKKLQLIYSGIGVVEDRFAPPTKISYIPRGLEDFTNKAAITYAELDDLVQEGLVRLSYYKGYGNARLTYTGRKKQLELEGWDRSTWYHAHEACCDKALPTFCVCMFRSICPEHGDKCHGSHD